MSNHTYTPPYHGEGFTPPSERLDCVCYTQRELAAVCRALAATEGDRECDYKYITYVLMCVRMAVRKEEEAAERATTEAEPRAPPQPQ